MRIHLVAIGGSAMHNLALALHEEGHRVSGSDDEIYEPARSRLADRGLLPAEIGWFPDQITRDLDAVILGMHARRDNPELARALELEIPVFSYPEFVYRRSVDKKRVVIAGSHGKTTTTSMIMHVLRKTGVDFDYLVGAIIPGFDTMVRLSDAPVIILEGDEYLSSCMDKRPKFLHYHPHVAVLTGISWDHINVFPEFQLYLEQFAALLRHIRPGGTLHYYENDDHILRILGQELPDLQIEARGYGVFPGAIEPAYSSILTAQGEVALRVFGRHNLENMYAAYLVCRELGVGDEAFFSAIATFQGASRRLQVLVNRPDLVAYTDFAHAPSKVRATVQAVRLMHPDKMIRAVLELHTYSSLNKQYLREYARTMEQADEAVVFYDDHTISMKQMEPLEPDLVASFFEQPGIRVFNRKDDFEHYLERLSFTGYATVFMSSGNFMGIPIRDLAGAAPEK